MNRLHIFLVVILLIGSSGFAAQRAQDQRGTEQKPLIIQAVPSQPSAPSPREIKRAQLREAERAEDVKYREQEVVRREASDKATLVLGWFTVSILVIQAIAFFRQAAELRRSVEEMKNATAATQIAARAAEQTVSRMQLTAVRQLRAYVSVKTARVDDIEVGGHPVATITVTNYGQTPAYGFATAGQTDLVVSDAELPALREPISTGQLGPSGEYILSATCPFELSATSHDQLKMGTAILFVHGIINYIDTYGESHFTRFRMKVGGGVPLDAGVHSCNEGNDTDDDERIFTAAKRRLGAV